MVAGPSVLRTKRVVVVEVPAWAETSLSTAAPWSFTTARSLEILLRAEPAVRAPPGPGHGRSYLQPQWNAYVVLRHRFGQYGCRRCGGGVAQRRRYRHAFDDGYDRGQQLGRS